MNDDLIDLRHDSSYITISHCILSEHNKALGISWTTNVTAVATINDNSSTRPTRVTSSPITSPCATCTTTTSATAR